VIKIGGERVMESNGGESGRAERERERESCRKRVVERLVAVN
jgi:hypothetical protein